MIFSDSYPTIRKKRNFAFYFSPQLKLIETVHTKTLKPSIPSDFNFHRTIT
jgi:hypothetical protein